MMPICPPLSAAEFVPEEKRREAAAPTAKENLKRYEF
jgi:hypothetical protein